MLKNIYLDCLSVCLLFVGYQINVKTAEPEICVATHTTPGKDLWTIKLDKFEHA